MKPNMSHQQERKTYKFENKEVNIIRDLTHVHVIN
jgi:hypothetical protein